MQNPNIQVDKKRLMEKMFNLDVELIILEKDLQDNRNRFREFKWQRERNTHMAKLQKKYKQLQEHSSQMEADFELEKLQLQQKFERLFQQKETELLRVQNELQQQIAACAHHIPSHSEEQAQHIISKLEAQLWEKEKQMVDLQIKHTQLQEYSSQIASDFEQEKRQLQQKFEGYVQQNEAELLKVQNELQQQIAARASQLSHQIISQLEAQLREKEKQMLDLQMEHTQLQEHSSQMGADFEQKKRQLQQKFEGIVQLKEKEISHLKAELQQHTFTNAQRIEEDIRRETELQSTLIKLGESEKRCEELQHRNNQLSNEAVITVQRFESELKEKQSKIDELNIHIKSIETAKNNFQIQSAEKAELAQQFAAIKELQKKDLARLQDMQGVFTASCASMHAITKQLQSTMTHTDKVFMQLVGSDSVPSREQGEYLEKSGFELVYRPYSETPSDCSSKIVADMTPRSAALAPAVFRRRKLTKRRSRQMSNCQLSTDSDDNILWTNDNNFDGNW
ncbi:interaptin-like [Drosophila innubila]|uniref:interaptin-like n=1 Tax=Drosophila innubila TaxID=198719 RepID=UPI00148E6FDE|nr:interaptin-like [Drosophila innubila]